ncbi:MAG: methionine--tRNA ligase [Candidatus Acidiferrales bacterium]
MDNPKPKYYLTTPIYYANSRPHVGSAYTTIVCDVIARYKRMCGYDVAYLTGTDEHGVNIERAAEKLGITPQQLVDKNCAIFKDLWKLLGIQYTDFVRTTSPEHARGVQQLVRRTLEKSPKAIEKRKYEGRYCIYDNLYVSDTAEPADCPICGRPAELISEENYFFRLSDYQERLLKFYEQHPDFVQPDFRFNEVKSFVGAGLKDVSISRRTIKWGIPWPGDPDQVFYVWYDALTSYMSGIGYASEDRDRAARFARFWPANVHMIGKEIIRFHAVYWPAFLMAAFPDKEFKEYMPAKIQAHGWLLFEQEKMSKSKGNVAYAEPIVKVLGNDALRYYLLGEVVFGQDGNFSREALITRYNAGLANGLGNLANRTLTMITNYCGGIIPEAGPTGGKVSNHYGEFVGGFSQASLQIILAAYDAFGFAGAVESIWALVASADRYLVLEKPWTLASDPERRNELERVLYATAEALRVIVALAHPVIPDATQKIWEQLGQVGKLEDVRINELQWGGLKPGTRIGKPEGVFPRADKQESLEKIEAMENEIRNPGSTEPDATTTATKQPADGATTGTSAAGTSAIPAVTPGAGTAAPAAAAAVPAKIGIEDFTKVELRVGVVKSAERIQGADKLLKLLVDIGDEVRQVLAGIALSYTPEELVGRKVVIVANLAPRKMRGLESNGMLLAASVGPDGKPVLCTFAEDVPPGAKVK